MHHHQFAVFGIVGVEFPEIGLNGIAEGGRRKRVFRGMSARAAMGDDQRDGGAGMEVNVFLHEKRPEKVLEYCMEIIHSICSVFFNAGFNILC